MAPASPSSRKPAGAIGDSITVPQTEGCSKRAYPLYAYTH